MTPFQEKLVTKKWTCYTQIVQSAKVRTHYGLWVEIKERRPLFLEAIYKKSKGTWVYPATTQQSKKKAKQRSYQRGFLEQT